ncbi:MAG: hypothetical protein ACI8QZ_002361 [Chlamydiales bacterium]|jgi:hypothetical protein
MDLTQESKAAVEALIEALTPIDETVTSDISDQWFIEHNKLVGDLMDAGQEMGVAALIAYANFGKDVSNVHRGLLTVAAHAAPEDSRDLLKTLMVEYGFPMDDRAIATRLLAETSPETFLEHSERFLRRRGLPHETAPPEEFFIRGWVIACEKLDRSPVEMLSDVVTNMAMEPAARHFAAEALGGYPGPIGRAALETSLVESSGNHYLRRKAAQALQTSLPRETACDLFLQVLRRETDYHFQVFLRSMIENNCR